MELVDPMFPGQLTLGLGRLKEEDRRLIEWWIKDIYELREWYLERARKIKWLNVFNPGKSLDPFIDDWVYCADLLWRKYSLIYAWLHHLRMEIVWAELGYELF